MHRIVTFALALICGFTICSAGAPARAATFKVVHVFRGGKGGALPYAGMINVNGTFYRTTRAGGGAGCGGTGCGTVFSLNPATGVAKTIYAFRNGSDGAYPSASLVSVAGILYGTTTGYTGYGTIFSLDPATGAAKGLHSFQGGKKDGAYPSSGLTFVKGKLYGTTAQGGVAMQCPNIGCGTIFSLNPNTGREKIVYFFQGYNDGQVPAGNLLYSGGSLYGASSNGVLHVYCSNGCGAIFAINLASGTETTLWYFGGASDGSLPNGGLVKIGGLLYGTTEAGGSSGCPATYVTGCGTVFSLDPATGTEKVIYTFKGGSDGWYPQAGLVNSGRRLFGTTSGGGSRGGLTYGGTIFLLNPEIGAEKRLHSFSDTNGDATPQAPLLNVDGTLYGTASGDAGTTPGYAGVIFSFTP